MKTKDTGNIQPIRKQTTFRKPTNHRLGCERLVGVAWGKILNFNFDDISGTRKWKKKYSERENQWGCRVLGACPDAGVVRHDGWKDLLVGGASFRYGTERLITFATPSVFPMKPKWNEWKNHNSVGLSNHKWQSNCSIFYIILGKQFTMFNR
jgi:hypothetical protein